MEQGRKDGLLSRERERGIEGARRGARECCWGQHAERTEEVKDVREYDQS
jgi:hypothetical protein